eukprot:jgi/Hompol1/903/HPOL_001322-RA
MTDDQFSDAFKYLQTAAPNAKDETIKHAQTILAQVVASKATIAAATPSKSSNETADDGEEGDVLGSASATSLADLETMQKRAKKVIKKLSSKDSD